MAAFPATVGTDIFLFADGVGSCTVRHINPDTGATVTTSTSVPYISPDYRTQTAPVGDGEVGATFDEFLLKASAVSFVPQARDEIEDEDGDVWVIGDVKILAYDSLYNCTECAKQRT
jgi:hypothetical protein